MSGISQAWFNLQLDSSSLLQEETLKKFSSRVHLWRAGRKDLHTRRAPIKSLILRDVLVWCSSSACSSRRFLNFSERSQWHHRHFFQPVNRASQKRWQYSPYFCLHRSCCTPKSSLLHDSEAVFTVKFVIQTKCEGTHSLMLIVKKINKKIY